MALASLANEPSGAKPPPTADTAAPAAASDPAATTAASLADQALAAAPGSGRATIAAFVILAAGLAIAWLVYVALNPADFVPNANYVPFAGLFVLALAIERLLEPFSGYVLPKTEIQKNARDSAVATAKNTQTHGALKNAANAQHDLDRLRSSRAVILWAVAAGLAMLASASLGFFLLRSLDAAPATTTKSAISATKGTNTTPTRTDRESGSADPNRLLDLFITGLVVGAGTKPLHDLVSRIQATSQSAKDPSETKAT